jgi:hypothetical protein
LLKSVKNFVKGCNFFPQAGVVRERQCQSLYGGLMVASKSGRGQPALENLAEFWTFVGQQQTCSQCGTMVRQVLECGCPLPL